MPENNPNQRDGEDNGLFLGDVDILEIREEDTKPATVSESFRKRLAERYAGKDPPALDPDLVEIREEDTKPGTVSETFRKRLREKYGSKESPPNGPAPGPAGP